MTLNTKPTQQEKQEKSRVAVNLRPAKIPQIYQLNKSNFDFRKYKLLTEQTQTARKKQVIHKH